MDKAFTYNTHTHIVHIYICLLFMYLYVVQLPSNNPGTAVTIILLSDISVNRVYCTYCTGFLLTILIQIKMTNIRCSGILHYTDMVYVMYNVY